MSGNKVFVAILLLISFKTSALQSDSFTGQSSSLDPVQHYALAKVELAAGRDVAARQHLQRALDLNSHNDCEWCDKARDDMSRSLALVLSDAINSGDYQNIYQFTQHNISQQTLDRIGLDMYAGYLSAESHFHGAFKIEAASFLALLEGTVSSEVIVRSENTQLPYRIEMHYTDSFPQKITRIRIRANTPERDTNKRVDEKQAIADLSNYIDSLASNDVFSGAVLIAKDDRVLLKKAVGMASKRFSASNNINTRFNLGSMNKMFTSIAILKLVEAGKLKLTDLLVNTLPFKRSPEQLSNIQIQHLLSHSSGIGQFSCEMGEISITADKHSCLDKLSVAETHFMPGQQYRYSNEGMFALGLVLEQLTGSTYDEVVDELVFEPADMTQTANLDLQFPVHNAAIGYSYHGQQSQWRNNLFIHDKKGGPAGGGYSTVQDLFNFAIALKEFRLLSRESIEQAWRPKTEFNATNYGFGFIVWQAGDSPVVGHNGSFPGVSSQMEMHLSSGYTLIVLSNHSFGAQPVLAKARQQFAL